MTGSRSCTAGAAPSAGRSPPPSPKRGRTSSSQGVLRPRSTWWCNHSPSAASAPRPSGSMPSSRPMSKGTSIGWWPSTAAPMCRSTRRALRTSWEGPLTTSPRMTSRWGSPRRCVPTSSPGWEPHGGWRSATAESFSGSPPAPVAGPWPSRAASPLPGPPLRRCAVRSRPTTVPRVSAPCASDPPVRPTRPGAMAPSRHWPSKRASPARRSQRAWWTAPCSSDRRSQVRSPTSRCWSPPTWHPR